MGDPDLSRERAMELQERLRAWLIVEMGQESPVTIGSALMYELTSLAAMVSASEYDAQTLLLSWVDAATAQLKAFGVGKPHP